MKWKRICSFLTIVVCIIGVALGTSETLWHHIKLGLDLQGGYDLVYHIDSQGKSLSTSDKQAVLTALQLRVDSAGIGSPIIALEDQNRINVEMAGTHNAEEANTIIGQTAQLKIYSDAKVREPNGILLPFNPQIAALPNTMIVPSGPVLVTGNDLRSNASWQQDPQNGNVVVVSFKHPGKWEAITSKYLNRPIYTFLGSKLINNATVTQVIYGGNTQITGMTQQQCIMLAKELNAGALPYPLQLVSSTNVGPSLGAASLRATMSAGLAAIILIFVFMIVMYRVAGLISNIALVAYVYMVLSIFSGMGMVLTLPGLAALVLGIGMAVDANIISFERIKDELKNGRSVQSSVIAGNRRSVRTILDSNVTTFIAGAVMFWFGQGDIRGFALALMFSIVSSLMTTVLLGRVMVIQLTRSGVVRNPFWYGIRKGALQQ